MTEFEAHFAMVRERFRTRLAGRLAALQAASRDRAEAPQDEGVLATIKRLAHDLAGAAGTFGFAELGEVAATLERVVMQALLSPEEEQEVALPLEALTIAIETAMSERGAA
jgi:HPt (histidine-containing phosphotransfer) domain-containing protein